MEFYNYIFNTSAFKIKKTKVLKALSGDYYDFYFDCELMDMYNLTDYDILKFDLEKYYLELRMMEQQSDEELVYEKEI